MAKNENLSTEKQSRKERVYVRNEMEWGGNICTEKINKYRWNWNVEEKNGAQRAQWNENENESETNEPPKKKTQLNLPPSSQLAPNSRASGVEWGRKKNGKFFSCFISQLSSPLSLRVGSTCKRNNKYQISHIHGAMAKVYYIISSIRTAMLWKISTFSLFVRKNV